MFHFPIEQLKSQYLMDFYSRYPEYVQAMKLCQHAFSVDKSNPFHIEDDVWAHTLLVLHSMQLDIAEKDFLTNHCRVISAICHDIGKIYTRVEKVERERVSFFGHEYASIQPAIDYIYDLSIQYEWSEEYRIRMMNIVLPAISHHLEAFRNIRLNEFASYCNFNYDTLLVLTSLMTADHNGRFFNYNVEGASGETDTPKMALDIGTEMILNNDDDLSLDNCRFILFGGVSGCGKDYYAKMMFPDAELLSYDNIRIEYYLKNNTSKHHVTATDLYETAWHWANDNDIKFSQILVEKIKQLSSDKRVVICNNHLTKKGRRRTFNPLRSAFKKESIGMVYVTAPSQIIYERNKNRVDDKVIKDSFITKFIRNQCIPSMNEGFASVQIVCNY